MPRTLKDYSGAVSLYESGSSISLIALQYGVTRQSMWQILKRRNVVFRPNTRHGEDNHFYRGGIHQCFRVAQVVKLAMEKGELNVQQCEICGSHQKVVGHHDDYNKPYQIRWLCGLHHYEWHKKFRPIKCENPIPKMTREEISSLGGKTYVKNHTREQILDNIAKAREKHWG